MLWSILRSPNFDLYDITQSCYPTKEKQKKTFKASEPIILWYFKVQIGIVELRTCGTLSYSTWKGPQNTCTHNKMLFCAARYIVDIIFIKNTYTNLLKTFYLYYNLFLVCWNLSIFCMVGSTLENDISISFLIIIITTTI